MTLGDKQRMFTRMLGELIDYAYSIGYELTIGRGYASKEANEADGGHKNSNHLNRLAIDLNLFKEGVFLQNTSDHNDLGLYWESIGGTWGGRFSKPDGNHYSIEHNGVK